jgi:hypothetical protein
MYEVVTPPPTIMKIIALALLPLVAAAQSSSAAAAGLPVDCVVFQDAESTVSSTLRMGQCLKPGDAICSSTGGWVFGIDPTDRTIRLWEDNRVSFCLMPIGYDCSIRMPTCMSCRRELS